MYRYATTGLVQREEYICRLVVAVYEICLEDFAFNKLLSLVKMHNKMQSVGEIEAKNYVDTSRGEAYTNNTFVTKIIEIMSRSFKAAQNSRMNSSQLLAIAGDGSATRAFEDTEIIYVKYRALGKIIVEFFDLVELDSKEGKEGTTADAGALFSTYKVTFESRKVLDFERLDKKLASISFDGANVMFGCRDSVASRFQERAKKVPTYYWLHVLKY